MALWGTTEWLSGAQQSDSLGHNRVALWGTTEWLSGAQLLPQTLSLCTSLCTLMWCRIHCEAAMALGTTASSDTEFAGLHALLKIFRARCHSSSASEQQPQIGQAQAGSNVGEYLVNETLPLAIACVRDEKGCSPPEAVEVLVSNFLSSCHDVCEWVHERL